MRKHNRVAIRWTPYQGSPLAPTTSFPTQHPLGSSPASPPALLALWLLPLAADGAGVSCVRVFVCETLCVLARLHINKQFFRCIRLFATRNLWTEQARLQLWALVLLACQKCSRNCFDIYKYHLHSVCLTTVL